MTIKRYSKVEKRQVVFYPTLLLVERIDRLVKSEDGKNSRSYIMERIIEDWFDRIDAEKKTTSSSGSFG